jgi:hypothetical protein
VINECFKKDDKEKVYLQIKRVRERSWERYRENRNDNQELDGSIKGDTNPPTLTPSGFPSSTIAVILLQVVERHETSPI